ncbi:helix-turn-helix transcriptional regulator [Paracoccus nototheniae]|uniref:Helix-turn-helix transcriptional regulator n=1 Tax=Paracoccus nototheniae TaxID=2489002 RepID=A0ABW4DWZ6_9RHOB|nr:helix-turn-helix domain-containing protein [Paracoccus nototheniae]
MNAQTPIFIRPAQVQSHYGIHRATLYRWAAAGHVRIHKRGAASFVNVAELSNFITGSLGDQLGDQNAAPDNSVMKSSEDGAGRGT